MLLQREKPADTRNNEYKVEVPMELDVRFKREIQIEIVLCSHLAQILLRAGMSSLRLTFALSGAPSLTGRVAPATACRLPPDRAIEHH